MDASTSWARPKESRAYLCKSTISSLTFTWASLCSRQGLKLCREQPELISVLASLSQPCSDPVMLLQSSSSHASASAIAGARIRVISTLASSGIVPTIQLEA